jgi:hypothetical protein
MTPADQVPLTDYIERKLAEILLALHDAPEEKRRN